MKRIGQWIGVLCLVWMVGAWAWPAVAGVPQGYEPQVRMVNPEGFGDNSPNSSGKSAVVDGSPGAKPSKAGGFWSWMGDRGMGLVKGIGAGLIGAAIVVGAAALVVGAGAPLLLMGGAAVLGGAMYGAFTGSANFNWTEAIVGSVIGGISAGVGSWIAGTGSAIASRIGVAAVDAVGSGIANVASYLIHEPNPTLGGALTSFGVGAGTAVAFMGIGASASKGWKWAKGATASGKNGKQAAQSEMLESLQEEYEAVLPQKDNSVADGLLTSRETSPAHPHSPEGLPSSGEPTSSTGGQASSGGEIPGQGYHKEVYSPHPVKPEAAVTRWEVFLGPGEYTNIHPRTGLPDPNRIVSADGRRSIRYGPHEMNSSPTKHHYHEEIWTLDPYTNVMNVDNTVVRVPLK